MKELDFDELDKAVNSLMTDVPKSNPPEDDDVKTLTITPSAPSATPALADSSETVNVTNSQPAPVRTSPLPPRRGGRFMDVVHPTSDMKRPETPKPVSRQGVTIAPDNSSSIPTEVPSPTVVQSEVEPKKPEVPPVVEAPSGSASEWPDPLDLATAKNEPEAKEPTQADTPMDTAERSPETPEEPSPLTSPFLPGTKVEKRPLGGAVAPEEAPPASNPGGGQDKLTANNPDDQLPASPNMEVEHPLPEELQGDLVAIESGAASSPPPDDTKETAPATPDTKPPVALLEESTPEIKEQPTAPTGSVSIPQQYREEPSTGDTANGSIYDTDAYHQPLAHPAKKKSGWMWVVWIVLILFVGAGVGAALYFFGII